MQPTVGTLANDWDHMEMATVGDVDFCTYNLYLLHSRSPPLSVPSKVVSWIFTPEITILRDRGRLVRRVSYFHFTLGGNYVERRH